MEKVSIVIPNFNGAQLLAKNLPNVLKHSPGCEIIVVDDASQDDSVKMLHKNFKKIRVIKIKQNSGFSNAANTGVKNATSSLVVLLNSDVSPRKNYLTPLLKYFKDKTVFSVGMEDQSHEQKRIIPRGRGGVKFKKGLLEHFAATNDRGISFWTSGGSSIYDREKFLKLGGFDTLYRPFYWEDIDLGYRAWKSGFKCLFEPISKVDHFHEEGAIVSTTSNFKIRTVSYRNQFLFFWKNIDDYYLTILHIVWLPYRAAQAAFKMDMPFYLGLALAIISVPKILMTFQLSKFIVPDREVLGKFEK